MKRGIYNEVKNFEKLSGTKEEMAKNVINKEAWNIYASYIFQEISDKFQDIICEEYQEWDGRKGRGLSYDLYGFFNGVAIFQERYVKRTSKNGFLSMKKTYYITNGQEIEEITTPLRYLTKDSSLDGVVKHYAKKVKSVSIKEQINAIEDEESKYIEGLLVAYKLMQAK